MTDLEDRVAALEATAAFPLRTIEAAPMSDEEAVRFREELEAAAKEFPQYGIHILPSPPPLTPDQVRQLLRECVTVVKPGEALAVRVPWDTRPSQVAEYQRYVDGIIADGLIPFAVLVLAGDELAVMQTEPEFMSEVRADTSRDILGDDAETVRLTHLPTGVTVEARTRGEAIPKLGRAIERHARRRETPARDFPPILAAPIPVRENSPP